MPKTAFLHKKSLLDTFKDDYRVTNPIKAARAERTWDNPIVRHKREREINKWAHSFAGKKHFRKLTRFNATREANESCRVLYPLEDVVKVVTDALRTIRTRIYQVDGYYQFIQDKLQYGMVVAKDIAHRDFPYRWEVQANLVTRLKRGNEIVMEYHPDTPEELSEYLQEEGALEPNEAKMKISVRESKKNEKDEPTYVWFGLEQDEDGDFTDSIAVFVDDVHNGMVTTYAHLGQHSDASLDYVRGLYADPDPKGDLYKELIRQGYDNLVVVNTNVAEDMLGVGMFPDGDQRADEDPDKFDKYESRKAVAEVTADERKAASKAFGLFADQLAGYLHNGAYSDINMELATEVIYDSLANTYKADDNIVSARATITLKAVATESADAERYSRELDTLVSAGIDEAAGDLNSDLAELGQCIEIEDVPSSVQGNTWVKILRPTWTHVTGVLESNGERTLMTAWTYLGELEKLEGADSRKEATAKLLKALGFTQGTEGRWYDGEGDLIDIIDELDNAEWDFAVKTCGPLQESKKDEAYYKGKDRGFLVLVQKLIADNWYAGARKKFPGLTLDCYEMDGAGDDMKICFEAYGEEIDDPMSEGLMEVAEEAAKKGCADANRSTDPLIADYGLEANFISWDEPDVFRDQWNYVINLSSEPKGKKGESADEKLSYEKGHKNSKGEPAPWVIRSHKDNSVIASFANKEDAYAHLQRMKQYSKTEGLDSYIKDVKALLKSKYGIDVDTGKQASLYSGWMEKLDACHYKGMSAEDCAEEVTGFLGAKKGETFTGRPQNYSYARIGHEVSTKWIDSVVGDLQDTLKEYNRLSGESVGVAAFTDDAKVDWELYLVGDDKEILHFVDALGYTKLMNKYPRLVDFDKVFVQHGSLDDLTNYGITASPYPGTMFDTPKKESKKAEALEKNGVIVVPEWLWVAYETGDSSNLSVEEEQILDGFRAMAAGKVFDAEAEPSFRAFNDFDDYAGNCYEVQVYTIKEGV